MQSHIRKICVEAVCPSLETIVPSTVNKILNDVSLKPNKLRYYLEKRHPEFETKMNDLRIVYQQFELYNISDAISNTIMISYDEKPGIQAIGNVATDLLPTLGHGFK